MEAVKSTKYKKIIFSDHASLRGQQRGIPFMSAKLAVVYGYRKRARGGGLLWKMFTSKSADKARRDGVSKHAVERARGVSVVCAERDGLSTIVTICPRNSLRDTV